MRELMATFWASLKGFLDRKGINGQALVEYALILVLVAIAVIVLLRALGVQVGATFQTITGELAGSGGS